MRHAALDLSLDVGGIEPRAAVVGDPVLQNLDEAGFDIHFHFRRAKTDLPKRRGKTERYILVFLDLEIAAAPDLAFRFAKMALHHFTIARR